MQGRVIIMENEEKPKKHRFKTSTHWYKTGLFYFIPMILSYMWISYTQPFYPIWIVVTIMYWSWFAIYIVNHKGNDVFTDDIMRLNKKLNMTTLRLAKRLQNERNHWKSRYFSLLSKQRKVVKSSGK